MGNKKIIALAAAVLAVILAVLLMKPDPAPGQTFPSGQSQTRPIRPEQTVPMTLPTATEPTETEPMETEPVETLPPQNTVPEAPTQTDPVQSLPRETEPTVPPTEPLLRFPVLLEDGMLTVQSIFSFTGMNPDAELQFGESIAGLQLANTSDLHLTAAELEAAEDILST